MAFLFRLWLLSLLVVVWGLVAGLSVGLGWVGLYCVYGRGMGFEFWLLVLGFVFLAFVSGVGFLFVGMSWC